MKKTNLTPAVFVLMGLLMVGLASVQVNAAGTRQRPFSDWLNVQGSALNPSNCASSVLGWLTPDFAAFARADYSGKICDCIASHGGPVINPEFRGTVTERDLPDGTAEILVN